MLAMYNPGSFMIFGTLKERQDETTQDCTRKNNAIEIIP